MEKDKGRLTTEILRTIARLIEREKTTKEICELVSLSKATVCRAIKNIMEKGVEYINAYDAKYLEARQSSRINHQDEIAFNLVENLLKENPSITQKGIQDWLMQNGILASQPKISRIIEKLNYTRKRLSKLPEGRNLPENLEKRREYVLSAINHQDSDFIFVDETGFNLHTNKYYGYAPPNCKAFKTVPNNRGRNCSLICAMSLRGIIAYKIIPGSVNSKIFSEFITDNLKPNISQEEKVLVMDNVKFHHSNDVIIAKHSTHLFPKFLLPYSPMLNPIDELFSALKANFTSNRGEITCEKDLNQNIKATIENIEANSLDYYNHMKSFYDRCLSKEHIS